MRRSRREERGRRAALPTITLVRPSSIVELQEPVERGVELAHAPEVGPRRSIEQFRPSADSTDEGERRHEHRRAIDEHRRAVDTRGE